jgi:hypothetical protein
MIITKAQLSEIKSAARPLTDWLKNNTHTHVQVTVGPGCVRVVEIIASAPSGNRTPEVVRPPQPPPPRPQLPFGAVISRHGAEACVVADHGDRIDVVHRSGARSTWLVSAPYGPFTVVSRGTNLNL